MKIIRKKKERDNDSGPKVHFVNGQLVVDEDSLVNTSKDEEEVSDFPIRHPGQIINQNSFRIRPVRRNTWTKDQTLLFYKGLRIFGSNLSNINLMLKKLSRRQLRDKFKKEEKVNPHLIEFALNNRLTICEFEF